jgi:glycine cleavage system H protein
VVFCELPAVGKQVEAQKTMGVVESVKAVSDVYAPVSGKVTQVNESLHDNPASLNADPYGAAWLVKVEMSNPAEAAALLDAEAYKKIAADH